MKLIYLKLNLYYAIHKIYIIKYEYNNVNTNTFSG